MNFHQFHEFYEFWHFLQLFSPRALLARFGCLLFAFVAQKNVAVFSCPAFRSPVTCGACCANIRMHCTSPAVPLPRVRLTPALPPAGLSSPPLHGIDFPASRSEATSVISGN